MDELTKQAFLNAAKDWLCSPCSAEVHYIAMRDGEQVTLLGML
ncbi:hypothetical protein [Mariprofundus sp. KV]|nr:hypothetical protein [Mariprofundus sp. KV]